MVEQRLHRPEPRDHRLQSQTLGSLHESCDIILAQERVEFGLTAGPSVQDEAHRRRLPDGC
jgi:hypothetical protein